MDGRGTGAGAAAGAAARAADGSGPGSGSGLDAARPARVANIEVLRLMAALGVLLHHLGHYGREMLGASRDWLAWPIFVGFPVPLFFVISGYVLAGAIERTGPGRYLVARALRLYPGYWLALGLFLLTQGLAMPWSASATLTLPTAATLGLWPAGREGVPYFLGVEWSLVYEVFLSAALGLLALAGGARRRELVALWLGLLCAKAIYRPNLYSDPLHLGPVIALSAYNAPFLAGILLRDWRFSRPGLRGPALLLLPLLLAAAATRPSLELAWLWWGAAAVLLLWLAIDLPQLSPRHPLVRLGACTYGLFLVHVPLQLAALRWAAGQGWQGEGRALWLAGAVALGGGLAFGALEARLYGWLRAWTMTPRAWPTALRAAMLRLLEAELMEPAGLRGAGGR